MSGKKRPFILYHWSPASRRQGILRHGLRVGRRNVAHSQKMPYLCFSNSPSLAWGLSGGFLDKPGRWDMWMVWSDRAGKLRKRTDLGPVVTEYRTFESIPKRHLWLVGTRTHRARRSTRNH